jgi:hypothetical protein
MQGIEEEVEDEATDKGSAKSKKQPGHSIGWLLFPAHRFTSLVISS